MDMLFGTGWFAQPKRSLNEGGRFTHCEIMESERRGCSDGSTGAAQPPGAPVSPQSDRPRFVFKGRDWLWALGLPIYILIGTARHELSHAFAATLEGAHVESIHLIPSLPPHRGVLWGYVNWSGTTTWLSLAAPYFCDLLTFLLGVWIFRSRITMPRWVRIQVFVIGVLSPAINSLFNYQAGLYNPSADVARVVKSVPLVWVGAWVVGSLALYGVGIFSLVKSHTWGAMPGRARPAQGGGAG